MGTYSRRAVIGLGATALVGGAVYSTYFSTIEYLASARGKRTFNFTGTSPIIEGQPGLVDGANTLWATVLSSRKEMERRMNWKATEMPLSVWDPYRKANYENEFLSLVVAVLPEGYTLDELRPRIDGDTIHQPVSRHKRRGRGESGRLEFKYQLTKWRMNFPYPIPTTMTAKWVNENDS